MKFFIAGAFSVIVLAPAIFYLPRQPAERVSLLRTPFGGIQPQAVTGKDGTVHLVYFKGSPAAGDLYYTTARSGSATFEAPVRVNSQSGSAVAAGTIRGGQLALGRGDRAHVVWNGSGQALPRASAGGSPLLYSRMIDANRAFESQRNLMGATLELDGGGTVAADRKGGVFVLWHAGQPGTSGEENRRLFIARSTDDGQTFVPEAIADRDRAGACPCCGTRAFVDSKGALFALYRGVSQKADRDMILLRSADRGVGFRSQAIHPWKVPT